MNPRPSKTRRIRADLLLVERGLCQSREQARRLIMAGAVRTGRDALVSKPGQLLAPSSELFVCTRHPFVSRGAWKLLPALGAVPPPRRSGLVALDVGASTGGFTDVLLQHGVDRVYAVDVGYGQLHQRLRSDPRVINLEQCNARALTTEQIREPVDILTVDVSFISLRLLLPTLDSFLRHGGAAYLLLKPQFEAGRQHVRKGGIVRDRAVIRRCVAELVTFAEQELGWRLHGLARPAREGRTPNEEWMCAFRKTGESPAAAEHRA